MRYRQMCPAETFLFNEASISLSQCCADKLPPEQESPKGKGDKPIWWIFIKRYKQRTKRREGQYRGYHIYKDGPLNSLPSLKVFKWFYHTPSRSQGWVILEKKNAFLMLKGIARGKDGHFVPQLDVCSTVVLHLSTLVSKNPVSTWNVSR